jgi:hypothetical protein
VAEDRSQAADLVLHVLVVALQLTELREARLFVERAPAALGEHACHVIKRAQGWWWWRVVVVMVVVMVVVVGGGGG